MHLLAPALLHILLVKRHRRQNTLKARKMFIPGLLWTLIIWTTILGATKAQPLSGHVLEPILTEVGGQVIPNIAQGMKNDP